MHTGSVKDVSLPGELMNFGLAHVKRVLIIQANSEGLGEPGYWYSLARAITVCIQNRCIYST